MSSTSSKPNLTRVRDNQRRSRARRKEYLQELEEKYRNCELMGAQASAEIQAAARKVLEENKQLRALLQSQGLTDEEIDTHLSSRVGGPSQPPPTAPVLETMLTTRKPCCGEQPETTPARSPQSVSALTPVSQFSEASNDRQHMAIRPAPFTTSGIPREIYSLAVPSTMPMPMPMPTVTDWNNSPLDPHLQFGPSLQSLWPDPGSSTPIDGPRQNDISSCDFAASMITSMRYDVSMDQVKQDLGCAPDQHCQIGNTRLFDVMDKYQDGDVLYSNNPR
ncbi:MAG: hypothetical protein MMC33_006640 [Icmadophila ericetorum]|nr:hypothetical protein [Icmadophila ericetorum]